MKRIATLLIVLAACAAERVWLIAGAQAIAKDGIVYVKMATEWAEAPGNVAGDYDYHVGYPAAISAAHRLLPAAGPDGGLRQWELTGQVISLVAALGATVAVWLIAGMTFNWRIAWITALVFGLGRKWAVLGADVLSDAAAVCLQLWAVVLVLVALGQLQRRSRRAILTAAGVGLCAGLGYLVRPEAILPVALGAALWLAAQARRCGGWPVTLTAAGTAVAVTLACALPYMLAIGGVTKKKSLDDFLIRSEPGVAAGLASVAVSRPHSPPRQFLKQLPIASNPVLAVAVCVSLGSWVAVRLLRLPPPPGELPRPSPPAAWLMLGATLVIATVTMAMYRQVHYLSHRHLMFLAALLSPLGGAGFVAAGGYVAGVLAACGLRRPLGGSISIVLAAAAALGLTLHAVGRDLHAGGQAYRRVAGILAARPPTHVLADHQWVLYYSRLPGRRLVLEQADAASILASKATHLVLSDALVRRGNPALAAAIGPPYFVQLQAVPTTPSGGSDMIRIYRICRRGRAARPSAVAPGTPGD